MKVTSLALVALCLSSASAISLQVEPVGKTVTTEKEQAEIVAKKEASEARKDAKLKENTEKVKVMKEQAVAAEMKAQDDADAEVKR